MPYLLVHLRYERLPLRLMKAAFLYGMFWTQVAGALVRHPNRWRRFEHWDAFLAYARAYYHEEKGLRYFHVPRLLLFKWAEGELFRSSPRQG